MNIITLLNQIKTGEIVLPAIQRNFVWTTERVIALLDSIMRGYPIGIALLWETYANIPFRRFVTDYDPDGKHVFLDNANGQKLKVVLDGQQRLQSLYVALYGTYDEEKLYFDVLSGHSGDDYSQERYVFCFDEDKSIQEWNEGFVEDAANPPEERYDPEYYVSTNKLFEMNAIARQKFRKRLVQDLKLGEEDELRIEANLSRFDEVFTKNETLLRVSIIDENLPSNSPERKTEADVLEIFIRVNRQGVQLSRSDLVFSILKLHWQESSQALPDLVRQINKGNSLNLDTDFVIRCLFAVSNLGAKYDLEILRNQTHVDLMRKNFAKCCIAIKSTIDFVVNQCWCQSSAVIGGNANLIPFVYYVFHQVKSSVPQSEIEPARKAFYLLGFSQPFSRYADSRLGAFLRNEMKPLLEAGDSRFPFDRLVVWVRYWERIHSYGPELLQGNPTLALHLLQRHTGAAVQYANNAPEIDHIFPRSTLRKKGVDHAKIDHFANFWILAKEKNANKNNKHPAEYFKNVSAKDMKRALIDPTLLDYRRYSSFLNARSKRILDAITKQVGLSEADFRIDDVMEA